MAQKHNSIEMWKRRLIAEISRDKKKAVILGVLLLLAVSFVGKTLLKSSPKEAAAAATPAAIASAGAPMPPGAGIAIPQAPIAGSSRAKAREGAAKGLTRDIFLPNASIFPRVASAGKRPEVIPSGESEREAERRRRKKLIQEQGAELQLESTITGRVPIAIINGTVLGPDGVINGFRIVEINSQACLVEKEGVVLKLSME